MSTPDMGTPHSILAQRVAGSRSHSQRLVGTGRPKGQTGPIVRFTFGLPVYFGRLICVGKDIIIYKRGGKVPPEGLPIDRLHGDD